MKLIVPCVMTLASATAQASITFPFVEGFQTTSTTFGSVNQTIVRPGPGSVTTQAPPHTIASMGYSFFDGADLSGVTVTWDHFLSYPLSSTSALTTGLVRVAPAEAITYYLTGYYSTTEGTTSANLSFDVTLRELGQTPLFTHKTDLRVPVGSQIELGVDDPSRITGSPVGVLQAGHTYYLTWTMIQRNSDLLAHRSPGELRFAVGVVPGPGSLSTALMASVWAMRRRRPSARTAPTA